MSDFCLGILHNLCELDNWKRTLRKQPNAFERSSICYIPTVHYPDIRKTLFKVIELILCVVICTHLDLCLSADDILSHQLIVVPAKLGQRTMSSDSHQRTSTSRRSKLIEWLQSEGHQLRVTGNAYQVKSCQKQQVAVTDTGYNTSLTTSNSHQSILNYEHLANSNFINVATDV